MVCRARLQAWRFLKNPQGFTADKDVRTIDTSYIFRSVKKPCGFNWGAKPLLARNYKLAQKL